MLWLWQQHALPGQLQDERNQTGEEQPFKRSRVTPAGQGVTHPLTLSQSCAHCGRKGDNMKLRQCASCKKVLYCSKFCQAENWTVHKNRCAQTSCEMVQSKTPTKQKTKANIGPLVGNKYLIDCYIQSIKTRALWDSGSQVTRIDEKWRKENLPNVMLRDINEIW